MTTITMTLDEYDHLASVVGSLYVKQFDENFGENGQTEYRQTINAIFKEWFIVHKQQKAIKGCEKLLANQRKAYLNLDENKEMERYKMTDLTKKGLEDLLKRKCLEQLGDTEENKKWLDDKLIIVMPESKENERK